jgi:hypothetical protein
MDVTTLANELIAALAPFIPYLARVGESSAESAGRQLGADAWEHALALWDRLGGRLEERPAALEAVQDAARAPDDDDARAALRLQVRKLLEGDEALAGELRHLLDERPPSVAVTASGERSIAVGRDVTDSSLSTGDQAPHPE